MPAIVAAGTALPEAFPFDSPGSRCRLSIKTMSNCFGRAHFLYIILLVFGLNAGGGAESCLLGGQNVPQSAQTSIDDLRAAAQRALDRGRLEEARSLLKDLIEYERDNVLARLALIDVLMRLYRWDEAEKEAELLKEIAPRNSRAFHMAAAVAFRKGNFEDSEQLASRAIQLDPAQIESYRVRALSRYMLQDHEGYRSDLELILKRDPENVDAHYHLGRYYYEKQLFEEGLASFQRVVEIDPSHYRALYFLGWCYQAAGKLKEAEEHYRAAIEIIEKEGAVYGWPFADLGDLLLSRGAEEEGLGWLYRSIRNDPQLPYAHFKYAGALLVNEASEEIERHLRRAVDLDPGYAEAYYLLGRYYNKVGDREKAAVALQRFQELRESPLPSPRGTRR